MRDDIETLSFLHMREVVTCALNPLLDSERLRQDAEETKSRPIFQSTKIGLPGIRAIASFVETTRHDHTSRYSPISTIADAQENRVVPEKARSMQPRK